jgi:hypothetical protein
MAAVYCMMRIRNPTRGRKVVVLTKSSMSGGRGMDGKMAEVEGRWSVGL